MPSGGAALPILLVVALAAPAGADHCEGYDTIRSSVDTGGTPGGRYYVHVVTCQLACTFALWVYEESNGLDGWQPKDHYIDATCHDSIPSDTLVELVGL